MHLLEYPAFCTGYALLFAQKKHTEGRNQRYWEENALKVGEEHIVQLRNLVRSKIQELLEFMLY